MPDLNVADTAQPVFSNAFADRLNGVGAIAAYLGCGCDAVYYARRIGSLPIRRLGRKGELFAFKSELDAAQKDDSTLPDKWRENGSAA